MEFLLDSKVLTQRLCKNSHWGLLIIGPEHFHKRLRFCENIWIHVFPPLPLRSLFFSSYSSLCFTTCRYWAAAAGQLRPRASSRPSSETLRWCSRQSCRHVAGQLQQQRHHRLAASRGRRPLRYPFSSRLTSKFCKGWWRCCGGFF